MKNIFLLLSITIISCCSAKKTVDGGNKHKSSDTEVASNKQGNNYESDAKLPGCIKKLVKQFKEEERQNPPRSVYSYTYNDKTVFFVPAICCDFFSDLYDDSCNLLGHPDGGFTGRGDGKTPDFIQTRTNEKLIWKDERK